MASSYLLTYGSFHLRNSLTELSRLSSALGDRLDTLRQRHLLNWRSDAKNLAHLLGTEADFLWGVMGYGIFYAARPYDLRLLQDPKWGKLFDSGFHCDRGGTVPLAMLTVFLEAKIALMCVQRVQLPASVNERVGRRA